MGIGSAWYHHITRGAVTHLIAMQQEEKAAVVCMTEAMYTGIAIFGCGCLPLMREQWCVKHLVALVATSASRERTRR